MSKYPKLVVLLTNLCDGWIVGSSVNQENPRDYDVFIPIEYWELACGLIPSDAKVNRLGGFKAISEEKEVDVWTGRMGHFLTDSRFSIMYHPKSGTKIIKQ